MGYLKFSTDDLTWNTATFNEYLSLTSWVTITSNFGTTNINSIAYGNGIWIAVGGGGARRSTDATNWTTLTTFISTSGIGRTITYANNTWVLGAYSGEARRSTDSINWTTINPSFGSTNILASAYGNSLWVLGGASGIIRRSTDSISWSSPTSNFGTSSIFSIASDNSTFIAVGAAGQLRRSTDAITWTTAISNFGSSAINSIAYGNNLWIATGVVGQMRGSTDGITWTTIINNFGTNSIQSITYNNGTWFIGGASGTLHNSTDTMLWTTVNSNFGTTNIQSIAYGDGIWIAVGATGQLRRSINPNKIEKLEGNFISVDNTNSIWGALTTTGQLWIKQPTDNLMSFNIATGYPQGIKQLITHNNQFIALLNNEVRTSSDLITWTTSITLNWTTIKNSPYTSTNSSGNYSPIYKNGIWMFPNTMSTDLINWTTVVTGFTAGIRPIVYENGTWVIGTNTGKVRISTDTITWISSITAMGANAINTIAYGNNLWIAGGQNGTAMRSTDAITWVTTNIMFGNTIITSIAYGDGIWVAAGYGATTGTIHGRISTSTDGITWTTHPNSNFHQTNINSIAYGNGLWVAVGDASTQSRIRISTNGLSWSTVNSNPPFSTTTNLLSVIYNNNTWVAAGSNGAMGKSTNGITWTTVNTNFGATAIFSIVYGQNSWIISSNSGTTSITHRSIDLENSINANKIIKTNNEQELLILANNGKLYGKKGKYETFWKAIPTTINDDFINGVVGLDYSSIDIDNTGRTWTSITLPVTVSLSPNNRNIAYANGLWVIGSGVAILYSTDFISWTTANSNNTNAITYIGNKENIWFALTGGDTSRRSTDAITWTTIETPSGSQSLNSMAYGQGLWLAGGGGASAPYLLKSTDTISWISINTGFSTTISSVVYGNGLWGIAGSKTSSQGGLIQISTDTITWVTTPSFIGNISGAWFSSLEYNNGLFFAKTFANDAAFRSTDLVNWTYISLNSTNSYTEAFSYYNNMYVMGSYTVYKSTDSITWTSIVPSPTISFSGGGTLFGSNTWVYALATANAGVSITQQMYNYESIILQGNNAFYSSTDMVTWTTLQNFPATNTVNAIISKD